MASVVEICNRGLQKLGAKRIVSLTENSTNGRACNAVFEPVKLAELRKHTWQFATKRASLAADSVGPIFNKTNSFELPALFIRLLPIDQEYNSNAIDHLIEGRSIITNDSAPLQIRYVYDVTDANLMDALFREALSSKIAYELAEELTQSNSKKAAAFTDYTNAIADAKRTNAIERIAQRPPDDVWVTVRR